MIQYFLFCYRVVLFSVIGEKKCYHRPFVSGPKIKDVSVVDVNLKQLIASFVASKRALKRIKFEAENGTLALTLDWFLSRQIFILF